MHPGPQPHLHAYALIINLITITITTGMHMHLPACHLALLEVIDAEELGTAHALESQQGQLALIAQVHVIAPAICAMM